MNKTTITRSEHNKNLLKYSPNLSEKELEYFWISALKNNCTQYIYFDDFDLFHLD